MLFTQMVIGMVNSYSESPPRFRRSIISQSLSILMFACITTLITMYKTSAWICVCV